MGCVDQDGRAGTKELAASIANCDALLKRPQGSR
jgi:hypothetical protein